MAVSLSIKKSKKSYPFEIKQIPDNENIYLITQFFIRPTRVDEIRKCLINNVNNKHIKNIILLNEKIYSVDELGVNSDKIIQVDIGKRLSYEDIFINVTSLKLEGYIIFANSDIYFDDSIEMLHKSYLNEQKVMIALLRYNIKNGIPQLYSSSLGVPRVNSQDSWIFHSKFNVDKNIDKFRINMGTPGCDNKIAYLMCESGYKIINCPFIIKTYHVHSVKESNPCKKNERPYLYVVPLKK